MADNKPTFHHMNNSQSQRILWLLEELNIDYNLVLHYRNPSTHPKAPFRSSPSLTATGPYGKAPLLITGAEDGSRYLPESSAIATYLIRTFDSEDKFGLKNGDWARDEMLVSMNLTSMIRSQAIMLYMDFGFLKPSANMASLLGKADLKKILGDLTRELKEGPAGGYFAGAQPGRADILLEYPISMVKHRDWVDLKEFPEIEAWLQRVYGREAWKRALEKGNGYDLSVFPKAPKL